MEYQTSEKGMELDRNLVDLLKRVEICEAVVSNSADDYTGPTEKMDLLQCVAFFKLYTYRELFYNVEVEYGQF